MALIIYDKVNLSYDYNKIFNIVLDVTLSKLKSDKDYDLSVSFVDDKTIRVINRDYRFIDKSTDVISFAMLDSEDLVIHDNSNLDIGDIFISIDTAKKQAKSLNQSLNREIIFLFIHGLLHLLGYDHKSNEDEELMFKLQGEILDEVIKSDYYKV